MHACVHMHTLTHAYINMHVRTHTAPHTESHQNTVYSPSTVNFLWSGQALDPSLQWEVVFTAQSVNSASHLRLSCHHFTHKTCVRCLNLCFGVTGLFCSLIFVLFVFCFFFWKFGKRNPGDGIGVREQNSCVVRNDIQLHDTFTPGGKVVSKSKEKQNDMIQVGNCFTGIFCLFFICLSFFWRNVDQFKSVKRSGHQADKQERTHCTKYRKVHAQAEKDLQEIREKKKKRGGGLLSHEIWTWALPKWLPVWNGHLTHWEGAFQCACAPC